MGAQGADRVHPDVELVLIPILANEALASAELAAGARPPGNWLGVFPFSGAPGGAALRAVEKPRRPVERPAAVDAYYSDGGHMRFPPEKLFDKSLDKPCGL